MVNYLRNRPLWVIYLTIFVDMLGVGILIPVIPILLADPSSKFYILPSNFHLTQGYIILGLLAASYPIAQFIAAPILGQLSDRFGRKPVLLISLIGTVISYLLFALGLWIKNIPLLFVSRIFDGTTGGNVSVAQAAIADLTPTSERSKYFGLAGAALGVGFIMGAFIGGKFSDSAVIPWFSPIVPFLAAAILSMINVLSVIYMFKETLFAKKTALKIRITESLENLTKAINMEHLRVLFFSYFLLQCGFTFFTTFFSISLIQRFNFTQSAIGDFFALAGVCIAVFQILLIPRIFKRFDERIVLKYSLIGTGIAIMMYFLPKYHWQLFLITPIFALFDGLSQTGVNSLISKSAKPEMQGSVLGISTSISAVASAFPPILSGYIAARLTASAPIFVSALVTIGAGLVFIVWYRPQTIKNR
ncbi:MAG: MFS transporter [candidate division WWE3 bacterium]|nr:MFS transporter [candidate division WWE3 bacterium]